MVFKALLLALLAPAPVSAAGDAVLRHPYWDLPVSTAAPRQRAAGLQAGETLEYEIYWGVIHVGSAFIKVDGTVDISSRPAWHIFSEAHSSSFIEKVYKVDDRNDSWMDSGDLSSRGYYRKLSEGRYFFNEWGVFDAEGRRFYGRKMNKKRETSDFEGLLERPVNDMLSGVYRLRSMRLEPGKPIEMDVNTRRNWRLSIKPQKREKIETPYGSRKCILVEPMAGDAGLFVSKAGKRMLIWITDDDLKLPMMLRADIFIGSVTAKLVRRTVP